MRLKKFRNLSHTLCKTSKIPDGVVLLSHLFLDFEFICNFLIPTCQQVSPQRALTSKEQCILFIIVIYSFYHRSSFLLKVQYVRSGHLLNSHSKQIGGGHNYCSCCLLASPASHAASSPDGTYNFYLHDIYLTLVILRHVLHKKHMILLNDLMQYYSTNLPRAST